MNRTAEAVGGEGATEFENFSARFLEGLLKNSPKNTNYVLNTTLVSVWREAMRTPGSPSYEYPRMMYRGSTEQRTVTTANEEQAAATDGFSRTPPLPDSTYPRWYCERPIAAGGTKVYDLRRVQVNNRVEEQQFLAAVNPKDWMLEGGTSHWGARGVHLADVVQERKEMLKQMIDQNQLEVVEPPPADTDADQDQSAGEGQVPTS